MKKITMSVLMASILLTTIPNTLMAVGKKDNTTTINELEKIERSNTAQLRLYEINAMDKSDLTFAQKKELRKEAKEIKKTYNNGGIYISAGAVILILILIIILL